MTRSRFSIAVLAVSASVALTLGACGSDDDDGGSATGADAGDRTAESARDTSTASSGGGARMPAETGDEGPRVERAYRELRRAFDLGEAAGVCDRLTVGGAAEVANYPFRERRDMTCEQVMSDIIAVNRRGDLEQPPFDIVGVDVDGYKAVAKVKVTGRPLAKARFARVDGNWKMVSLGLNRPPSLGASPQPRR
jgi:hypothetical protein